MNELKPCPFCGSENIVTTDFGASTWFVQCDDCGATFPHFDTETEAIAAWNRRTGKDINVATNADRIRSMSDKELAEYIFDLGNGPEYCYGHCAYQDDCATKGLDYDTCIKGITDWLRQPVKED